MHASVTNSDHPPIKAAELLGQDERAAQQRCARERARRIAYAQGVLDIFGLRIRPRDLIAEPRLRMSTFRREPHRVGRAVGESPFSRDSRSPWSLRV